MKKIIAFTVLILFLLFISCDMKKRIDQNTMITNGIDLLTIEKELYDEVKSTLDTKYETVEYGLYHIDEKSINFYVSKNMDFDNLNLDKEVVIDSIDNYDNKSNAEKYLNFYLSSDKLKIGEFYDEFNDFLVESKINSTVDSRVTSLENGISIVNKLPIYLEFINIIILFLSSLVLIYVFIYFNNKSKNIAIYKLYGFPIFTKLDYSFIFISIFIALLLKFYYCLYFIIFIGLIYLIKYYLYYKCNTIKSINGKPIINKFETLILIYNTVIKIIIFSFYILFIFIIPRITEFYSTYELWNKLEYYSLTDDAFVKCCGKDGDSINGDLEWRSNYYNFMYENYQVILIPITDGPNSLGSDNYEVSKSFFDIQNIELDIDEKKGALLVRDKNSPNTNEIKKYIDVLYADDELIKNIPIIDIGDIKIYTFDSIIGYDQEFSYIIYPRNWENSEKLGYVLNSNQIIYKNINQDNEPIKSFYESENFTVDQSKVDPSFYELGRSPIEKFNFIATLSAICLMLIIFINLFLTKNIIDMYEEKNVKLNTIKKILGYSNYEIHKYFYFSFHFIDILIFILIAVISYIMGYIIFGLIISLIHLCTSVFASYLYVSRNENNKVVESLKGKM